MFVCAKGVVRYAHRITWVLTHGDIPPGMFVCHRCDNPPCCNPAHLFLGTAQDNQSDMVRKKRSTLGQRHPNAVLNDEAVRAIRRRAVQRGAAKHLAREYGVSLNTIYGVISGREWSHVTEEAM